jgi:CheY-like chemotaxis protein
MLHSHLDTWRVLLIDQNPLKQNLRATILRNYEIEVHTAASVRDAEDLWTTYLYDLILLAAQENSLEALTFPEQVRKSKPRQRIALLVGAPTYIREVGGIVKPRPRTNRAPQSSFATDLIEESPSRPQWQQMIELMMTGRA